MAVSDFILGKTDVNAITAGNNITLDDVVAKLDTLDAKLSRS